jgi:hypothetical protein
MIEYPIIRLFRMSGFSIVHELNIYGERLRSDYKDLSMIDGLLNPFLELRLRKVAVGLG